MSNMTDKQLLEATKSDNVRLREEAKRLKHKIAMIVDSLEKIVVPDGIDAGVILLSDDSPTKYDPELKVQVYLHENFSPLGDALVNLHKLCVRSET